MGCTRTVFPGGMGFACTRGLRQTRASCRGTSVALCDWPLAVEKTGKTCDRAMCEKHRTSIGPNVDYCEGQLRDGDDGGTLNLGAMKDYLKAAYQAQGVAS